MKIEKNLMSLIPETRKQSKFESFESFEREASVYITVSDKFIVDHKLDGQVIIDHICFKCESSEEYDSLRKIFEVDPSCKYLYQVNLSGRRVAYLGLRKGFTAKQGEIMCIELADKKPGHEDRLGFNHVEIYPKTMGYDELVESLVNQGVNASLKTRPHHTTHDISLPDGFMIRLTDQPLIKKITTQELSS